MACWLRRAASTQTSAALPVTEDELAWLGERVEQLAAIVETICSERIAELENTARDAG